jgi:HK97 family phage major capsid protein
MDRQLIEELRRVVAGHDGLVEAVKQMENDQRDLMGNVEKRIKAIRGQMYDGRGQYRGAFACEDDARAFGLIVMAHCSRSDAARSELKKSFPDVYEKAMSSTSQGAIIPPEFANRIVLLVEQYGVFDRNAFIMPMTSDSLSFIKQTGELTVYLVGENTAGTTSDPTSANITLNAKEWGTLTYYPRTLGEDAAPEVGELVARSIARAFALKMDQIGFNGDGSATYFGVVGLRQRLVNINSVDDGGGLVLGTGNAYSELTLADFEKVAGALPEYASADAKWYVSRKFYWEVMVKLALAVGGVTAGEVEGKRQLLFLGYPVQITQVMPSTEANSQVCALFGDLRQAATIGRRREMSVDQSTEYKFAERQVTVLGTRRVAVNVHDVGTATEAGPIVGLITAAA